MPETETLKEVLLYVFGGGGSGLVAYWLMETVPRLDALSPSWKRYVSLALSAALAMLAFLGAVGLNYVPSPVNNQAWVEALFAVAFVAVGGSQVTHGKRKL